MRGGRTAAGMGVRAATGAVAVLAMLGLLIGCSKDDKPGETARRPATTAGSTTTSTSAPVTVAAGRGPVTTPAPPAPPAPTTSVVPGSTGAPTPDSTAAPTPNSTAAPGTSTVPTDRPEAGPLPAPLPEPPAAEAPPGGPPPTGVAPPGPGPAAPARDDFGAAAGVSKVAQALGPDVSIYDAPDGSVVRTLANPNENGAPLVFLVAEEGFGWLKVDLPVRPNGSTGWIRADQVSVAQHDYRIDVSVGRHQIAVVKGTVPLLLEPVGIGTTDTPTPGGTFYIKELLQPPDPSGTYGPYAYGLSGFSNVLTEFNGGAGVIGIHGTNQPQYLGTDVSAGCIRMSNDGITRLSGILPLGVPIRIMV